MTTDEEQRISARVTGRVQGVGFRNFTRRWARRLGIGGWVRNEQDGSVRLVAEGRDHALQQFVDALEDGPRAARVESVSTEWEKPKGEFDGFRVRF